MKSLAPTRGNIPILIKRDISYLIDRTEFILTKYLWVM